MRTPGVCWVCGCTDDRACQPNGCAWANEEHTLCDSPGCVSQAIALAAVSDMDCPGIHEGGF